MLASIASLSSSARDGKHTVTSGYELDIESIIHKQKRTQYSRIEPVKMLQLRINFGGAIIGVIFDEYSMMSSVQLFWVYNR